MRSFRESCVVQTKGMSTKYLGMYLGKYLLSGGRLGPSKASRPLQPRIYTFIQGGESPQPRLLQDNSWLNRP